MRIVVTGGCGFIASHLVDRLIAEGHQVVVIDNLSTGSIANLNTQAEFFSIDITNLDLLKFVIRDADAVFHVAALPRIQKAIDAPMEAFQSNVLGTMNVFEACRQNGVKRVIYSSSSSVYGKQYVLSIDDEPVDELYEMSEDMGTNPLSLYAAQKLHGEHIAEMYSKAYGMTCISLRYFNVYGPKQTMDGDYCLVLGKFMQQKRQGKKLTVYGNGEQFRSFTYVGDVVEANLRVLDYDQIKQGHWIMNVGNPESNSVNELALLIAGSEDGIEYVDNPRGQFEEFGKQADISTAKSLLNWYPSIKLREGVGITLKYYEDK